MSTLDEKLEKVNPAVGAETRMPARERIPMTLPRQRLSVPEIPGFVCHWFVGNAHRIEQALAAGYSFVRRDEVDLNRLAPTEDPDSSGHTDLGSRVTILSGLDETTRDVVRLILMKIPLEWYEADQKLLADRNEAIASVIRGDRGFVPVGGDASHRYVPREAGNRNLFHPKLPSRS